MAKESDPRFLATAILILAAVVSGSDAQAQQTYPARTVQMLVPSRLCDMM